jgi:hypothetical protein
MMDFYFRLQVLRRDIENLVLAANANNLGSEAARVIASRLAATLIPGRDALIALAPKVKHTALIDRDAMNTFDSGPQKRAPGTMRERLDRVIARADEIRAKVDPKG